MRVEAIASENGAHYVTLVQGNEISQHSTIVDNLPAPFTITGQLKMVLEDRGFPRLEKTVTHLVSWTEDPATRNFSGTGRYEIDFNLPAMYIADDILLQLDPGSVGNIVEIKINGIHVGVCWMRDQTLDITGKARSGANHLTALVTNTLINRVSAFTEPPPIPENLASYYGSGTTPFSRNARGPMGFKHLPSSGLIGPVRIIAQKKVRIDLK